MARENSSRSAYLSIALGASLWGCWSLVLRPANIDGRWSTALVFVATAAFGAPLAWLGRRRGPRRALTPTDMAWVIATGAANGINCCLFFVAMTKTTVALAVLSHYLAPVLVPFLAPLINRTPRQRGAFVHATVGAFGLMLMLEPWRQVAMSSGDLEGAILGATSAFFYAAMVCFTKNASHSFRPTELVAIQAAVAALGLVVVALTAAPLPPVRGALTVGGAAVVINLGGSILFARGVAKVPAEHASILTFLEPVTAISIGALFFSERLGLLAALGGFLILAVGIHSTRVSQREPSPSTG